MGLYHVICLISFSKVPLFFSPFTTCKLTETASNLSGWHWYWPLWLESTWVKMAEDSKVNNSFLFEKSLELLESGTICQSSDNGVPSRYLKKKVKVLSLNRFQLTLSTNYFYYYLILPTITVPSLLIKNISYVWIVINTMQE